MAHRGECILPSGTAELLVIVGDPFRVAGPESRSYGGTCLTGVLTGPLLIEQPPRHSVVGVRLRPGATRRLLGLPLAELGSPVISLDDLLGRDAARLAERCHAARSTEEIFRIVAGFIDSRLDRSRSYNPRVAWSTAQIERSRGRCPSPSSVRPWGCPETGSHRRFRATSASPRSGTRGCSASVTRPRCSTPEPVRPVAQLAGYYYRPHMSADFREFAGYPPHRFLTRRYPIGVTAAEPG